MRARSDKGTIRINLRDLRCLSWVLEMGAAYEDDLTRVISPGRPVSVGAARAVVRRWEQADLAQANALFANRGRLVRLTEKGAALVGGTEGWEDNHVAHSARFADAARARLMLEQHPELVAGRRVAGWVGHRRWQLENEAAGRRPAVAVDGVARFDDGTLGALRVERTDPGPATATAATAATELLCDYQVVVFVFTEGADAARDTVRQTVRHVQTTLRRDGVLPGEAWYLDVPDRFDAWQTPVSQ